LQTLSVPAVPPAGWLKNRISVSDDVEAPVATVTLRPGRFSLSLRADGRTSIFATSVAGTVDASVTVAFVVPTVIGPEQNPAFTSRENAEPAVGVIVKLKVRPAMPFELSLQISSTPADAA
jgi:hypothetical protein